MTDERYDDRASDPVKEIKARIRWLDEMLKQLKSNVPTPRETKH
jgi:hypothetical protein